MKYLIEKKVIYDTESGQLEHTDHELIEGKKLTKIPNDLLALLIGSQGQVLEREFLLEHVWESEGHVSSSASLNQYISLLRKTLTAMTEVKESIIVVPRVGFYFSENIAIEKYGEDAPAQPDASIEKEQLRHNVARIIFRKESILYMIMIVLFLFILEKIHHQPGDKYEKLFDVGSLEKCVLKSYEELPETLNGKLIDIITQKDPELSKTCATQPAEIMLYVQRNLLFGGGGRIFISRCQNDSKGHTALHCENKYIFSWGK